MPIDDTIKKELDNFDSIFKKVDIKSLKLSEIVPDVGYEGYSLPRSHLLELENLLKDGEKPITKREVVDLFLSMHYTRDYDLSIKNIIKHRSKEIKMNKMREIAKINGFNEITDKHFSYELEFSKEIEGWNFFLFLNDLARDSSSVMIASIFHKDQKPNEFDKSKELSKIIQKFKQFLFKVDIFGASKKWDNKDISPNSNDIYQDIITLLKDNPDSKKLNLSEILKDMEYFISTDIIKLPFEDEYSYFSYYPFLLINGRFNIKKIQPNLTEMRKNLNGNRGRYLEVSIFNPTLSKWNELKKDLIDGLKVIS